MDGFVSSWKPQPLDGEIHACPEDQFFALLRRFNPGVAAQLDAIYHNGFDSDSDCPGTPDCVQVTFDPAPDQTAHNVVLTSQPVGDAHTLALQASSHALSASIHVDKLGAIEGVPPKTLGEAHAAAASAHSAAARALASAAQLRAGSAKPSGPSAPPAKKNSGRKKHP